MDLAEKLKTCLDELPKLGIKGVLQGDLLTGDINVDREYYHRVCMTHRY